MPNRVQWTPDYSAGNETLDDQHRKLLEQCNTLADYVSDADPASDLKFREIFDGLMALAREHFSTEEALLARCGYPLLDEHKDERDEFEYLAADIITTENFEKIELQRFLALWWVGHIMGSGKKYRAFLEQSPPP
jgi:hemerythrin